MGGNSTTTGPCQTMLPQQTSFLDVFLFDKSRKTRREVFLAQMDQVIPWASLIALIEPFYPKGLRGRPPIGIERMLRLYFVQLWNSFSDEGAEDALYDMPVLARFVGIDLTSERVPDATTLKNFRHLLEAHSLVPKILAHINALLADKGLMLREGTIVDATLIAAPPSTKNKDKARDPEMHQAKKGNQWHFGMKMHIGVDASSGLTHTAIGTSANTSDVVMANDLLHGDEKRVYADAGYTGVAKRPEHSGKTLDWNVAHKRGQIKKLPEGEEKELICYIEKLKASVRAKVEHPFHVIKNLFGHRKTRYRGITKNEHQWQILFALTNVYMTRKVVMAWGQA